MTDIDGTIQATFTNKDEAQAFFKGIQNLPLYVTQEAITAPEIRLHQTPLYYDDEDIRLLFHYNNLEFPTQTPIYSIDSEILYIDTTICPQTCSSCHIIVP